MGNATIKIVFFQKINFYRFFSHQVSLLIEK